MPVSQSEVLNEWSALYAKGDDVFTLPEPNENILRWLAARDAASGGPAPLRACVPLCGRSADLALLASRPNTAVLGIDAAAAALQLWGDEHGGLVRRGDKVDGKVAAIELGGVYTAIRYPGLRLLCADIFDMPPAPLAGKFDLVWDRGGYTAVPPERGPAYLALVAGMLARPRAGAATGDSGGAGGGGALLLEAIVCNLPMLGALRSSSQALNALAAAGLCGHVLREEDVREAYPMAAQHRGLQVLTEVTIEARWPLRA